MKLTSEQLEAARDNLVEVISSNANVEEWLWDEMQEALENEVVFYNLYADYYESSLSYIGVSSLETIISEMAE
jgi:hypothetical protein